MSATAVWWIVQHDAVEPPGLIGDLILARGERFRLWQVWDGDIPSDADWAAAPPAALVVMGGAMAATDDAEFPFLPIERRLLVRAVTDAVPVLGVCLGAQLLAAALGEAVWRGPVDEFGSGFVSLNAAGIADPVLGAAGRVELPVVHWHHDTFALPAGAVLLASSDHYENQAFRIGDSVYGLQFHVEASAEWAEQVAAELDAYGIELDPVHTREVGRAGRAVIDAFIDLVTAEADRRVRQNSNSL